MSSCTAYLPGFHSSCGCAELNEQRSQLFQPAARTEKQAIIVLGFIFLDYH